MSASYTTAGIAAAIAVMVGFGAGYQFSNMTMSAKITELEQKVTLLETAAAQPPKLDIPTDEQASAAIQKSGRAMKISECKQHPVAPGVICTGTITTTTGSFAGSKEAGTLSFAKIDGVWTQTH
ncbi:hypothetical protein CFBP4996_26320 (plasmid) [Agrobacterium leguminum]|uniref:hypothetical protein n=1 Tax=Agrobacterium leguminum TaxID=2792015 RepID=UPI0010C93E47|nr:hypothetical protein [Agrobacterium leguminum]WFS69591.1 hypothetical protein CFBP4996_26320 [Agrobacterium leguminum]